MSTATADPQSALSSLQTTDNPQLREEVTVRLADVKALKVSDADTYALAGQHYIALGALETKITTWWEPLTSAAHKLHKALTTRRGEMVKPITAERERLASEMSAWKSEQDRLQRERELAAALEEKKRQDAIAAEQAALLEVQGHSALAESVIQQAIEAPAPTVSLGRAVPKVAGLSYRTVYEHEVVNLALVPREWLCLDDAKVKKYHEAMGKAARIPGVAFTTRDVPVGRSA